MALMSDKRALMKAVLPDVEITVGANGIIVKSERICAPRFIPYDKAGRCSECKSTEVEIDYAVTKEGVTIWCSRIKGSRFVPVDIVRDYPGHTFIKIKNKGRVFNVPHGDQQKGNCFQQQADQIPLPATAPAFAPNPQILNVQAQDFMNSISAATTFMEFAQRGKSKVPSAPPVDYILPPPPPPPTFQPALETIPEEKMETTTTDGTVQEFMDSVGAATTFWTSLRQDNLPKRKKSRRHRHQPHSMRRTWLFFRNFWTAWMHQPLDCLVEILR